MQPPEAFYRGLRLYWQGMYWHAHEAWEDVWRSAEEPYRSWMQALIQIAAALIHADRAEWRGVRNLLLRVLRYLRRCPDEIWGVDVRDLERQVQRFLQEVESVRMQRRTRFHWSVKPRIHPGDIRTPRWERVRRSPFDVPIRDDTE